MAEKKVSVRFTAEGARIVRSEMEGLGTSGAMAFQKIDTGQKSAQVSAETFARAIEQEDRSFKALRASIDPAFAAQQRYATVVRDANRAVTQGVASHREAQAVIAAAAREMRQAQSQMGRVGTGFASMRGQVQNASFQIADFATQVQGGTRVSTALAQQLPQMAAGFGVAGAAAGAVLAIGIPLVSYFLNAGEEAASLSERVDDLSASMADLEAAQRSAQATSMDLARQFGANSGVARELLEIQKDVARLTAQRSFVNAAQDAAASFSGLNRVLGNTRTEVELAGSVIESVQQRIADLRSDPLNADINNIKIAELQQQILNLGDLAAGVQGLSSALGVSADEAGRLLGDMLDLQSVGAGGFQAAAQQAADLAQRIYDATDGLRETDDETRALYDSLVDAAVEGQRFAALDMASPLAAAADQASRLAGEIQRAVDNAIALSAQGLSSLKESEIALRFKGDPVGRAGALARERFGDISGLDPILRGEMAKMRAEYVQSVQQTERNRQELADWQKMQAEAARSSPSTGGRGASARGGGGGRNAAAREAEREAAAIRKVVENLQDEIDLFGADEQARKLNQELRRAGVELYSEEGQRIADLVEQLSELERQQEITDRFLSDMQSISDALAQAIVNGENLGDAMGKVFRKMAADLLSSGLNNLFTSLFTGGGGGGLFGSIFGGGTQVARREHGGRATAGQPYIVGERRPELFVPDMSGTILPRVPQASAPAAAPQRVELVLHAAEGVTVETVRNEAGAMIRSYDRALPGRVKSINADPYAY